ncbi:hypothetical protein [Pseudomonas sp. P97.38]|uniref:hypothetical protein n=1 Tax=Pseudomonas sp. P97.38 TaxID=255451 RepID=UPI0009F84490|nr:hypothetical protein [Pseudomonas sp. P97.38]
MIIWLEEQQAQMRWMVHLDACCVSFRSADQALAFTRALQARIDAPHVWPRDVVARTQAAPIERLASAQVSP